MTTISMRPSLAATFAGEVLTPSDAGYDETRAVWNAMVDRRPRLILRCRTVGDVVAAVRTARDLDLRLGVRCGGHSGPGFGVPDGGVMADLSPMGGVRVDPLRRRAWVQGGALLGALDRASQAHGLATTAGNVSHTGVGGLTLGGGFGWLARMHGLACDNVESYQVVTADGAVVRASATERPELFWGLRGGGGNFGIVTQFEFRLHPVGTRALVAEFDHPLDRGVEVLRRWRDANAEAPRQAMFTADVGKAGHLTVGFVWVGDPEQGRRLLPVLRSLGRPTASRVVEQSYLRLQTRDDTAGRHALRRYAKGHYLDAFPDAAIEAFLERGGGDLRPGVGLQAYGGAIADVPDDDSAFSHRRAMFEYGCGTGWTDPAEDATRMAAARRCADALERFANGAYVNAISDVGADSVRRAYPEHKLARLTALKDAYDPDNVFRLNHNIVPTGRRG